MNTNNKARNILIHLACTHNGDWQAISDDLKKRDLAISDEQLSLAGEIDAITYLDEDYPSALKNIPQPPFVLFRSNYPTDPAGMTEEYRLSSDFQALACIQRIREDSWDYSERAARQEVIQHFDESPTIAVTEQAEIEIRNGNQVGVYREWYSHKRPEFFYKAARIASALSKDLFIFHAKTAGLATLMIATHAYYESDRNIYVLPHQWTYGNDTCNDFISHGATPLTRSTLAAIKTDA